MTNLTPEITEDVLMIRMEEIRDTYGDRLLAVLSKIKDELERFSWFCAKPKYLDNSEYSMLVSRDRSHLEPNAELDSQDLEVVARIMDSRYWGDGTRGGIAFNVDVISYGGDMIGGYMPASYTESIWTPVTDEDHIERRMCMIENADPYSIVKLIDKWQKGRLAR